MFSFVNTVLLPGNFPPTSNYCYRGSLGTTPNKHHHSAPLGHVFPAPRLSSAHVFTLAFCRHTSLFSGSWATLWFYTTQCPGIYFPHDDIHSSCANARGVRIPSPNCWSIGRHSLCTCPLCWALRVWLSPVITKNAVKTSRVHSSRISVQTLLWEF